MLIRTKGILEPIKERSTVARASQPAEIQVYPPSSSWQHSPGRTSAFHPGHICLPCSYGLERFQEFQPCRDHNEAAYIIGCPRRSQQPLPLSPHLAEGCQKGFVPHIQLGSAFLEPVLPRHLQFCHPHAAVCDDIGGDESQRSGADRH